MFALSFFFFRFIGFSAPHDRNENSSPSSTMLTHQPQHQSVSQSSMSYNIHMNSIHKNLTNSSTSSAGGYNLQNMKEEPNTGTNNYSSIVNGTTQDDMAVREQKNSEIVNYFFFFLIFRFSFTNRISDYLHIPVHTRNRIIIRCHKMHKIKHNTWKIVQNFMLAC